ncbi:hypothetical protein V6X71_01795 [Spiribacter sp. 388]
MPPKASSQSPSLMAAARELAASLVDWSVDVIDPVLMRLCDAHAPGYPGVRYRIGCGRQTCYRHQPGGRGHTITYGVGMVADHLCGNHHQWTHTREIARHRFVDGNTSPPCALAHIAIHETAHALQSHRGGRRRGSVHNAAFYKAVGDLYDALGRDRLMDGTRQLERAFVQGRASAGVTGAEGKPDPRAPINPATKFCKGQQVCFATPQGQVITAHIDRVNKVTCTVTCMQSGQGYRVPHALLWP